MSVPKNFAFSPRARDKVSTAIRILEEEHEIMGRKLVYEQALTEPERAMLRAWLALWGQHLVALHRAPLRPLP